MPIEAITENDKDYFDRLTPPMDSCHGKILHLHPQFDEIRASLPSKPLKFKNDVIDITAPYHYSYPYVSNVLAKNDLVFADGRYSSNRSFTYALADGNQPEITLCKKKKKNLFQKAWKGAGKGLKQLGKNIKSVLGSIDDWARNHAGQGGGQIEIAGANFGPNAGAGLPPPQPPVGNHPLAADFVKPNPLPQGNLNNPDPFNTPPIALPPDRLFPQNQYNPPLPNFGPNPLNPGNYDVNHLVPPHPNFYADAIQPNTGPSLQTNTPVGTVPTPAEVLPLPIPEPEEKEQPNIVIRFLERIWVREIVHEGVKEVGLIGQVFSSIGAGLTWIGNKLGWTSADPQKQLSDFQDNIRQWHVAVDDQHGTGYAIAYDPELLELKRHIGLEFVDGYIPFGPGLAGRAVIARGTAIELRALPTFGKGLAFEDIPLALREIRVLEEAGAFGATARNVLLYEHPEGFFRVRLNGLWEVEGNSIKSFDFGKVVVDRNKLDHLFDLKHDFGLLNCSREDALSKITRAVVEADRAGKIPQSQPFQLRVPVNGFEVEVHGIVLDGELRYGTFFIPNE